MKCKKIISVLIAFVIMLNWAVPFQLSAETNGIPEEYSDLGTSAVAYPASFVEPKDPEELQNELDELTYEILSLREENIKHIRLPDGSFQAVVYGKPVHRLSSDGNWAEIDNTLAEIDGMVATADSRFSFEKQLPDTGHIYQIVDGKYCISVSFPDSKEGVLAIIDNPNPDIGEKTKLERLTEVETLSSSLTYSNILPGIDLRYTLVSNDIKEDIIVKEPCESYSYSFEIATDGLSVGCENGKIIFSDVLTSKDVYYIPVPFMCDDAGAVSYEVFYSLEELQQGIYRLTVTADEKWINSTERRFPVIIDPSLTDIGQIDDTFVASVTPGTNYGGTHELIVANNMEVYYKFATPHLPSGTNITSAYFKVPYFYNVGTSNYVTVELYKVTSNWYEDIVTWNTKPTVSTCLDTRDIYQNGATASNPGIVSFSATNYIQSWYSGTSNYGFALKYAGGNGVSVSFVAKEKMQIFSQIVIYYQGTHLSEGIYAIQKQGSNCYFESYRPATMAWVLQDTTFTSPPLTTDHLENLFKLAYRPANDDYVIRSMIDSSLVIYPSVYNGAPIAGYRTESDSSMPSGYTWKIEKVGSYYFITYTESGVKYYIRSNSTSNGYKLVLTTNPNDTGTKWIFNSYTGNEYEDVEPDHFKYTLTVGELYNYIAYMRSTRIDQNGPVNYRVRSSNYGTTNLATIDSATGELTPLGIGTIKVGVTYPGAPWVWYWSVVIRTAGCRPYDPIEDDSDESYETNCQGYACDTWDIPFEWCAAKWSTIENAFNTSNGILYGSNDIDGLKTLLENNWLDDEFEGRWEEVFSSDGGWDVQLDSNQWLIVFRVHWIPGDMDYHFWYRTNTGKWANKHGWHGLGSELLDYGDLPTNNYSDGWKRGEYYYYDSDIIYYVLTIEEDE